MSNSINFSNKDNLEQYVVDNIELINDKISKFKKAANPGVNITFDETDIKNYLKTKLYNDIPSKNEEILTKFASYKFVKSKIVNIANEMIYYKSNLEECIKTIVFEDLGNIEHDSLVSSITDDILQSTEFSKEKSKFIKTDLTKIITKSLPIIINNGYCNNINNNESGVQLANSGDSAQFIFVGRAILAGFNCSNVDVRSSRYDAIIDYKGVLFKVQVKGISGNQISFKDRDRGGRGIDTHNSRNIGKRITSDDCDIYVAVDKQVGSCYIIPMDIIDDLPDESIKSMKVSDFIDYYENWKIIDTIYKNGNQ